MTSDSAGSAGTEDKRGMQIRSQDAEDKCGVQVRLFSFLISDVGPSGINLFFADKLVGTYFVVVAIAFF